MSADRDAAVVGDVQPLVGVGRPRVRAVESGNEPRTRGGGPESDSTVHMQPATVCVRDVRQCADRIDRARVHIAGLAADDRRATGVRGECRGQRVRPHRTVGVCLRALDARGAEALGEHGENEEYENMMEEVESLKQELHEVNLLNSKLLYVSKLFKENNLSENQKLKIVDTFDKATTAREAKLVYETLNESISAKTTKAKHSINESLSFASKSAGVAAPKPIMEIDATVARFQKLAGLN